MIINSGSGLCATIAFGVIEIKRVDRKFADGAFESDAAIQGLGGVITHI